MSNGNPDKPGRIFVMNDQHHELVPLQEALYDSEKLLQELLANHPDLLAGDLINSEAPRRWLLVTREMTVPSAEDGTGRWSLDHLFLDQDAVPTLIEVKRSTDSRIRRHVIGQMLDYAANAVVYWPVEHIQSKFEARCENSGVDPHEVLLDHLKSQDSGEFWQKVKTNLQAGRIRMVFVSDSIPAELRRVVEFLNEQMDPAEVLAVEVKQFAGPGIKTLVPRVFGQTETARQKKSGPVSRPTLWDLQTFLHELRKRKGEQVAITIEKLLEWLTPRVTDLEFSRAQDAAVIPIIHSGTERYRLCRIVANGRIVFRFDWLKKEAPFGEEPMRRELLSQINRLPGANFSKDVLAGRARIPLDAFVLPEPMERLKSIFIWMLARMGASERDSAFRT